MPKTPPSDWLLIFYSVPAHPVSGRMKIWRRLARAGAVQLKGAVYILPCSDEHQELFQWIIGEVKSLGGDGSFVRTPRIETLSYAEVRRLFNEERDAEYRELEKAVDSLERSLQGTRKSGRNSFPQALASLRKTYEDIRSRDFFDAPLGKETSKRLQRVEALIKGLEKELPEKPAQLGRKDPRAYRRRVWVTRTRPFIDRMASAWLIRRFVDPGATFRFIDEKELGRLAPSEVAFDMQGGEFTHHGELCSFEVLVRSFGIKDRAVRKIAGIVHDLDLKDDKYGSSSAGGIEEVLTGIRKTAKDDAAMLEQGMAVFEMLYRSRT